MALLPIIKDDQHFSEVFKDNSLWSSAVSHIIEVHQLKGLVERGTLGSHIVYRVGDAWIKMMAPIYAKDMLYETAGLKSIAKKLSIKTPIILAEGSIENWPYIILSHVEGEPIKTKWNNLDFEKKTILAKQLGRVVAEIKNVEPNEEIIKRFDWNNFIQKQYDNCEADQIRKMLPEAWASKVKNFLSQFNIAEFQTHQPVFLHADLTYDHFLVVNSEDKAELAGIIDMADCQIGHYEYEIVAPCTFVFRKEKEQIRNFLLSYGYAESELNDKFSEKMLAWGLLHRYFRVINHFKADIESLPAGDFSSLAKLMYPLSN